MIEDLEIAVDRLGTTRKPDQISKWTALAFLSRVCLYEGTYRKYHTELNLPDAGKLLHHTFFTICRSFTSEEDQVARLQVAKIRSDINMLAYIRLL